LVKVVSRSYTRSKGILASGIHHHPPPLTPFDNMTRTTSRDSKAWKIYSDGIQRTTSTAPTIAFQEELLQNCHNFQALLFQHCQAKGVKPMHPPTVLSFARTPDQLFLVFHVYGGAETSNFSCVRLTIRSSAQYCGSHVLGICAKNGAF
jgi:hypothetical protein